MKMLSMTQPYASAIPLGLKTWETRSWPTKYRGPLGIHAAIGLPKWAKEFAGREWLAGRLPVPSSLPMGAVVAVADLVDVLGTGELIGLSSNIIEWMYGNYSEGRFAWKLENVKALAEPIPAKGALGLWTPGPELERAILEQLSGAKWPEAVAEDARKW